MHYYNEWDTHAAQWLQNLCDAGLIPAGHIDTQDIRTVPPSSLKGITHAHFFAGIGGWPYAMQLSGWPPTRPLWTASCPCQPFSNAGQRRGTADDRHLWPALFRLIRECHPDTIVGEQVASAVGHGWLDGISADLEAEGYAVGAVVLGAHSVGAPHIRQRLYWVALAGQQGLAGWAKPSTWDQCTAAQRGSDAGRVDQSQDADWWRAGDTADARGRTQEAGRSGATCGLVQSHGSGWESWGEAPAPARHRRAAQPAGCWDHYTLIPCLDGKTRRLEPGLAPLVDGLFRNLATARSEKVYQAKEAIEDYAATIQADPRQVLSAVWADVLAQAIRSTQETRGVHGFQPEAVLLDFMQRLASALNDPSYGGGGPQAGTQDASSRVRGVRGGIRDIGASYRRKSDQQRQGESSNTLPILSRVLACCATEVARVAAAENAGTLPVKRLGGTPPFRLADGRTREGVSRQAVLKGIGNAIVPQVAAAFLQAFLATETEVR